MIGMFLSTRTMGWCPQKEKMVKNRHYDVPAWRAGCRIPRHGHQRVWPHGAAWGGVWEGGHPQCPHLGAILMEKVCLHPWAPTTNSSGAGCVRPWIALQKVGHEWKWSVLWTQHMAHRRGGIWAWPLQPRAMQASGQMRLSKKEGCLDAGVKSDDIFLSVGPPKAERGVGWWCTWLWRTRQKRWELTGARLAGLCGGPSWAKIYYSVGSNRATLGKVLWFSFASRSSSVLWAQ